MTVAVVIPNWNGRDWLSACLDSVYGQSRRPDELIVVDNGSEDDSRELIQRDYTEVRLICLDRNYGFAAAVNRGIRSTDCEAVALINTDVVLSSDWLTRMTAALEADPKRASIACKMLDLSDSKLIYDCGNFLRKDGVCEQRGRFMRDDGSFDKPGEIFSACAGAALYRRQAVLSVGGFDERFFCYIEDVDLGLRLALAGWRCYYEPVVALHAGSGSSQRLKRSPLRWVQRNTLLLIVKTFPLRWLPAVAYRQLGWFWHAIKQRQAPGHIFATLSALPLFLAMIKSRREIKKNSVFCIGDVVDNRPFRGPRAGGHRAASE